MVTDFHIGRKIPEVGRREPGGALTSARASEVAREIRAEPTLHSRRQADFESVRVITTQLVQHDGSGSLKDVVAKDVF